MLLRRSVILAVLLSGFAAAAQSPPPGIAIGDTAKGKALTDAKGLTLYTFDEDRGGNSSCFEKCLVLWPLLKAPDDAAALGGFTVITRKDGPKQWAYKGAPLYYSNKDNKPGDIEGDGFRDSWHIAKP